jgi:hypothetical protein
MATSSVEFEGASGASQLMPEANHECSECHESFALYSALAFVDSDNAFSRVPDPTLSTLLEVKFTVKTQPPVFLKCFKCCGKHHGESYLGPGGKFSSRWQNAQKVHMRQTNASIIRCGLNVFPRILML